MTEEASGSIGDYLVIENCEIYRTGWPGDACGGDNNLNGVELYEGDTVRITNNIMRDMPGAGIRLKSTTNTTQVMMIDSNVISECSYGIDLGTGGGGSMDSCVVVGNVIYNVPLAGTHLHDGSQYGGIITNSIGAGSLWITRCWIYNNTIHIKSSTTSACGYEAGRTDPGFESNFFNNIIWDEISAEHIGYMGSVEAGEPPDTLWTDYNMYFGRDAADDLFWAGNVGNGDSPGKSDGVWYTLSEWQALVPSGESGIRGYDVNSTIDDPLFTDGDNNDYALQAGSPAATAGRGGDYPSYIGAKAPILTLDISGVEEIQGVEF